MQGLVSALLVQLILQNLYNRLCWGAEKDCFKSSGSGKRSSFWLVSLSSTSFSALSFLLLIFFMQNSQLTICQVTLPPFLGSNIHSKYLHCLLEFPSILARVCCLLIDLPATTNSLPPPPPCPTLFFLHFPSLSHKTFLGDVSVSSWSVSGLLSLSKECPNSPALVRALLPNSMPPFPPSLRCTQIKLCSFFVANFGFVWRH